MKCIVRKLKATIDNANLPEFKNVVLKNYITTTVDGQYITMPDIAYSMNNAKMEGIFEATVNNINIPAFGLNSNQYIQRNNGYVRAVNTSEGSLSSIAVDTECHAGFDTSDGSFFINATTGTCSSPSTSPTRADLAMVFAAYNRYGSKAGAIKIKQIKITDTTNNLVYTLVPAEVNGVACLYDADRGKTYGEVNGGTLLCS